MRAALTSCLAMVSVAGAAHLACAQATSTGNDTAHHAQAGTFVKPVVASWTGDLDGMLQRRVIRLMITPSRGQYWFDRGQQNGAEYELSRAFERWINKRYQKKKHIRYAVVVIPTSRDSLFPGLVEGHGDIAAGILTITPERLALADAGAPFITGVREIVVTGPGAPSITSVDDLAGASVFVRRSSSYWSHLDSLSRALVARGRRPIDLVAAPEDLRDDDILEMVNAGLVTVTVVDRYQARLWKQVFPKLELRDSAVVNDSGAIAWFMRKNSRKLKTELDAFARAYGSGSSFGNQLIKKYTTPGKYTTAATSPTARRRFEETVGLFRKYGPRYSLDPLLLMAQGYQESQLQQSARSPVGAIGVMQIMPETGKSMRVGDIYQVEPNIHAGVKFTRAMIDEYFANEPMTPLQQTLFAFAAYNAGPGRVRRLRTEAVKRGLDPNVWFGQVELVAADRIGAETVGYVSNIYKYYVAYTLLAQQDARRDSVKAHPMATDSAAKP